MTLLSVLHRQQSQDADCLAACTQIVLHYLQISITCMIPISLMHQKKYSEMSFC